MPLVKNDSLDGNELGNFQSISNVSTSSKLLVAKCLDLHLDMLGSLPAVESTYCRRRSTETTIAFWWQQITTTCLSWHLDLTMRWIQWIIILLQCLLVSHNISGTVLASKATYVKGLGQYISAERPL